SIAMAPAEKPRIVGPRGRQSPIIPMIAQVPTVINEDYLAEHLCSKELLDQIRARDLVGRAIRWSIDTSERINRNEDKEDWETAEYEEARRMADQQTSPREKATPRAAAQVSNSAAEP